MSKVLVSGGIVELTGHGLGYYLHYLLFAPNIKTRVYAALTMFNSVLYIFTGKRWRDTLFQSIPRIEKYCDKNGLKIEYIAKSKTFFNLPVFLYFRLKKV